MYNMPTPYPTTKSNPIPNTHRVKGQEFEDRQIKRQLEDRVGRRQIEGNRCIHFIYDVSRASIFQLPVMSTSIEAEFLQTSYCFRNLYISKNSFSTNKHTFKTIRVVERNGFYYRTRTKKLEQGQWRAIAYPHPFEVRPLNVRIKSQFLTHFYH